MSPREVRQEHDGEAVSVELPPLLHAVCDALAAESVQLPVLHRALRDLLLFLASPEGRTNANCWATDMFFAVESGCDVEWDELPAAYRMLIDDLGGALHDTVAHPEVAARFESTPEQLLDRLGALVAGSASGTPEEAALTAALRDKMLAIAGGDIEPREGVRGVIYELVGRERLFAQSGTVLGDTWGIEGLVGAYHQYADVELQPDLVWEPEGLAGRDAAHSLDEQIVRLARRWMQEHGA